MKIDLTVLQQKLAMGEFVGFTLIKDDCRLTAENTSDGKLGAAKLALTKLGATKTGVTKP